MESVLIVICLLITFLAVFLFIKLNESKHQMKVMQHKLDRLADQSGSAESPVNDDLRKLIKEGRDVKAVKMAREAFGMSLVEGKQYIDRLKAESGL